MTDIPPSSANLNMRPDANPSPRGKLAAFMSNGNVINGVLSGVVGAMAAALIGVTISSATKYPWYYLVVITVVICAVVTSITFWFCSKAVINATRQSQPSGKRSPLQHEPLPLPSPHLTIQEVSSLYDSFRDMLAHDVFTVLWHRPDPSSPIPEDEVSSAVRKINSVAYRELDDQSLGERIQELARTRWMPTLILDGAGFSLEGDSYDMNAQLESAQKAAIGKTAAALIRAGMSVGLDGGTTTLQSPAR